jgi:Protein of unknown function (DUF3311)
MTQSTPPAPSPARRCVVTGLLIVALAGALWVPIYARPTPRLGGFPFFYWYQLVWVPVVAVLCWICHQLLRPRPAPGAGSADGGGERP